MFQKLNIWAMALVILSFFNHGQAQQTGGILIFVDQTTSIQSAEFTRWQQDCLGYVRSLRGNRSIRNYQLRLLPIHAQTYSAAPILNTSFSTKAGIKYQAQFKKVEDELAAQLAALQKDTPEKQAVGNATDLFSTIERIVQFFGQNPATVKEVRFYSDMLQWSTEYKLLNSDFKHHDTAEKQVEKVMHKLNWQQNMLDGIEITIIKAGTTSGASNKLPTQLAKKVDRFWQLLFEKLGGQVKVIMTV